MADFDVRAFDNDGADHTNDFNSTTDEGWFVPTDFATLGATYPFYLKHYNTAESAEIGATGTGLFNPFLNMNGDSTCWASTQTTTSRSRIPTRDSISRIRIPTRFS